ncbi:MAG: AAA family ATPase [Candidatus Nealsonbacteria bacterium]|nr:AAA family ATPase [Candidatus Nealsonbacteria bacterium]
MLTSLRLLNYRSHRDSILGLTPVGVLVGPVASGKSNIFKGLVLVQTSVHRSLVELFPPGLGEFHWVRTRSANQTDPIGFEVEVDQLLDFPDQHARYKLQIVDAPDPTGLYVLEETLERRQPNGRWEWVFQRRSRWGDSHVGEFGEVATNEPTILNRVWHNDSRVTLDAPGPRFARAVAKALSSFGYYHLEVSSLKALGEGQPWNRIGYRGEHLPDFLAWLKSHPEEPAYAAIMAGMREILPEMEAIHVTQLGPDKQGIAISFKDQYGHIAAPDLSDGTLLTLGLLCIIHGPKRPAVLCIEEPESGLHPRRLRWLFDRLLGLGYPQTGEQPTQVILSTHSPYLVDFFRDMPQCVQVVEQCDGQTRVTSLPDVRTALHHEAEAGESIGHQWATGLYEGL